jgi:hypothetical protein
MRKLAIIFALTALTGLSACSSTVRTYTQTLKLAFAPGEGATLTKAELASRDYDALYAKVGNLPRAVLGLAFIEHGQRKWISADNALLVLDGGRLVKTTGFQNDLLFQSDTSLDPLKKDMVKIKVGQKWQSLTDWSGQYEAGYLTKYEVINTEVAQLEIMGQMFQTKLVTEQVMFANGSQAINQFWFDLNSGYLLRSLQTIAPFWPEVELVHISTAGRLMGIRNKGNKK